MTQRIVRLVALAIAVSATFAATPAIAADAASTSSSASAMDAKSHVVPKVVGWIASNAVTALHSHGFTYAFKTAHKQKVATPSRWTVTKQSPPANSKAKSGAKITLTVVKTSDYLAQGARRFYAQDYGTFPPITQTASGDRIFALPKGIKSAVVFSSYSGAGAFTITELSAGNVATKRVLVNAKASYSGSEAFGLVPVKARTTAIRVSGSGSWRITIAPIASAPIIKVPMKSRGDHVYLYSGPSAMWTVSSPGPTTFILNQISSSSYPNLAVNESGNWAGPVALQPGPSVIEIHSNGVWSIH